MSVQVPLPQEAKTENIRYCHFDAGYCFVCNKYDNDLQDHICTICRERRCQCCNSPIAPEEPGYPCYECREEILCYNCNERIEECSNCHRMTYEDYLEELAEQSE
jgi:hypothetical protein